MTIFLSLFAIVVLRLAMRITQSYSHSSMGWAGGRCTVNISTGPNWPAVWEPLAHSALQDWKAVGAQFVFNGSTSSRNYFACYDNGTWGGRLALTYCYPQGPGANLQSAQTAVNTYYVYDPSHPQYPGQDPSGRVYNLETVVKHELGHAAGLGHSSDPSAVMYTSVPAVGMGGSPKQLSSDDHAGMRSLYP